MATNKKKTSTKKNVGKQGDSKLVITNGKTVVTNSPSRSNTGISKSLLSEIEKTYGKATVDKFLISGYAGTPADLAKELGLSQELIDKLETDYAGYINNPAYNKSIGNNYTKEYGATSVVYTPLTETPDVTASEDAVNAVKAEDTRSDVAPPAITSFTGPTVTDRNGNTQSAISNGNLGDVPSEKAKEDTTSTGTSNGVTPGSVTVSIENSKPTETTISPSSRIDISINDDGWWSYLQNADKVIKNKLGLETARPSFSDYQDKYINNYNINKSVLLGQQTQFRRTYVFMTMPECEFYTEGTNTASDYGTFNKDVIKKDYDLWEYIADGKMDLASWLSRPYWKGKQAFCFPLMNLLHSVTGLPSFEMKTRQTPKNIRGLSTNIPVDMLESLNDVTMTFNFKDDKQGTAVSLIYMMMRYIEGISSGKITLSDKFIKSKKLPYTCSFYIFVTDETGHYLSYWWKLVGCYPVGLNPTNFEIKTLTPGQSGDIEVPFRVSHVEYMKPTILYDFNMQNLSRIKALNIPGVDLSSKEKVLDFMYNKMIATNNYHKSENDKTFYDALPDTFLVRFYKSLTTNTSSEYAQSLAYNRMKRWGLCMDNAFHLMGRSKTDKTMESNPAYIIEDLEKSDAMNPDDDSLFLYREVKG